VKDKFKLFGIVLVVAIGLSVMSCNIFDSGRPNGGGGNGGGDAPWHNCDHHGHSWGSWQVEGWPDCTNYGWQIRWCHHCGHSDSQSISPLGNDWGEWEVESWPNCTNWGVERRWCQICWWRTDTQEIPPLGNIWNNWSITTPPTYTASGVETRTCQFCGWRTQTRLIPPLGHDCDRDGHIWGDWVMIYPPTLTMPGAEERTCISCGTTERRPIPAYNHDCHRDGHIWNDWVVTTPATPTSPGEETRWCNHCGHSETRTIPPLAPGEGGFSISFAVDMPLEITGPTVSIAAGGGTVTLLNPWQFDSIEWFQGEDRVLTVSGSHGQILTLSQSVHDNRVGIHRVTLEVSLDGIFHSRVIVFTVVP